jgi:hypothetical protein
MLRHYAAAVLFLAALANAHGETIVDSDNVVNLALQPAEVRIGGINRQQQLLVTAETSDGRQVDVTHLSTLKLDDAAVARLAGSLVRGVGDGQAMLTVSYAGARARIPVRVEQFDRYPDVHFINDIVPLFSKLRCNGSGCHGKQAGQNGFKLSVFGFNPRGDYNALVKEARGRRVFPAVPERSLLWLKTTGTMPHGGGRRAEATSLDAELIQQWVRQGTPWGVDDAPQLASIKVEPAERMAGTQADQQLLVTATFSDGSQRDVTHAATYTSNADGVAQVDQQGRVATGNSPGEAAITVNYMGQVGASRILVPRATKPDFATKGLSQNSTDARNVRGNSNQGPGFKIGIAAEAGGGDIDRLVWDKLQKLGIEPSEPAGDSVFFRRLFLDTIGTVPRPDEVRAFLADSRPDKRQRAIDLVLEREEFADYWALKWADILLVNSKNLGERGAYEFHRWLRDQIANNRPYDEWVRELITASGNSGKYGPVNFYRAVRTPNDLAKTVSQAFLGIRLDCAQCHHHPYEKWGQEDFYGMAGYFTGIQQKQLAPDRELVYHSGHQPALMPLTKEVVPTQPLGGEPLGVADGDPRLQLAEWLTSPDNPWFAKLAANRLWKHFLGRGLVEPEDDIRSTNPATNEPLLAHLSRQVVDSDYDLKAVTRLILNSQVYQLSSVSNETNFDDQQNFSHYLVKRMPAEVLLDAMSAVTESAEEFAGFPSGTRSIQLWDNRLPSYFLDTFGRSERESPCECAKSSDPTMAQALHLMNGPEVEAKIGASQGRVARLVAAGADQGAIVDELCLAAFGREPDEDERAVAAELFSTGPDQLAAEDFLWTLMNSYDFLFIH